jgi:hypothetical protein
MLGWLYKLGTISYRFFQDFKLIVHELGVHFVPLHLPFADDFHGARDIRLNM